MATEYNDLDCAGYEITDSDCGNDHKIHFAVDGETYSQAEALVIVEKLRKGIECGPLDHKLLNTYFKFLHKKIDEQCQLLSNPCSLISECDIGGWSGVKVFASSGVFSVPANKTKVMAYVIGAGGGGSGGQGSVNTLNGGYGGGGGGGGGLARKLITGLSPDSTINVTVGPGGVGANFAASGNSTGSAGGTSSFGSFVSASGGGGSSNFVGGVGGRGIGGDINNSLGYGGHSTVRGGNPYIWWGGHGGGGTSVSGGGFNPEPGTNGDSPGRGGSGASNVNNVGAKGGDGANGLVVVYW